MDLGICRAFRWHVNANYVAESHVDCESMGFGRMSISVQPTDTEMEVIARLKDFRWR